MKLRRRKIIYNFLAGIVSVIFLAFPANKAFTSESQAVAHLWQGAILTHILTPSIADNLKLDKLTSNFEVTEGEHVILLSSEGDLFDLKTGTHLTAKKPLRVSSFTHSAGLLVVIRNDRLGWYEDGEVKERFIIPSKGMKLAAGRGERIYLYGSRGDGSIVYLLEDNKVILLLEIPRGIITAFTSIGERVFFAVDNVIYTMAKGEQPGIVFIAAGEKRIHSLAADPIAGMLYFSAGEAIYAMRAGIAITILRGLNGTLRYSKNALFVLDPERKRMVKIQGLEGLTVQIGEQSEAPAPAPGAFKE